MFYTLITARNRHWGLYRSFQDGSYIIAFYAGLPYSYVRANFVNVVSADFMNQQSCGSRKESPPQLLIYFCTGYMYLTQPCMFSTPLRATKFLLNYKDANKQENISLLIDINQTPIKLICVVISLYFLVHVCTLIMFIILQPFHRLARYNYYTTT